jgi:hypothetical protein
MPGYALTFGAATTDRVDCGSDASITDLDPYTWLCWVYPTTLTAFRQILNKASIKLLQLFNTLGDIRFQVARASATTYNTNDKPLAVLNQWYFVAGVFDSAATQTGHVYTGTVQKPAVESAYGTATAGSGAVTTDAGGSFEIANRGTGDTPIQGSVGTTAVIASALSLQDIRFWQRWTLDPSWRPDRRFRTRLFMRPGKHSGGMQIDYSGYGNHGALTGGVPTTNGVPTRMTSGRRSLRRAGSVVAGGGGGAVLNPYYRVLGGGSFGVGV